MEREDLEALADVIERHNLLVISDEIYSELTYGQEHVSLASLPGMKERTIMIASSVFVLAALTMTGIYMKSNNTQEQDDGYTIDFTALENNAEDKYEEIARNELGMVFPGEYVLCDGID